MMGLFRKSRSLVSDRRGVAAAEFALLAPALIFLVVGVLEMALRFRASEEAARFVHQAADLVAREEDLETEDLVELYNASIHMMKPLQTTDMLDFDISQIGFDDDEEETPFVMWRRVAGAQVDLDIEDADDMGTTGEGLIRVAVRYNYVSPITSMFDGTDLAIVKYAYTRPRASRLISLDDDTDDGGEIVYLDTDEED
jgi:Flp pilus assembly protein TadG